MKTNRPKREVFILPPCGAVARHKSVESEGSEEKRKGVNDMRKHGNGLEVGRAGTMEVKATKGAESTKAPKKQTGGDLRSTKR